MKKCKWYNNSKAAVVLTIDDLSFGYMNIKSLGLNPQSDWGYGIKGKNSIFNYFEKFLLCKYPEIKYTVMLPFGIHSIAKVNTKYEKYLKRIMARFRRFAEIKCGSRLSLR